MLERADKESTGTEGVVHNQRHALLFADLRDRLDVGNVIFGVSNALEEHRLRLVVDGRGDFGRTVAVEELGLDTETRQHDLELVVGAAVEGGAGHDVVAGMGEG